MSELCGKCWLENGNPVCTELHKDVQVNDEKVNDEEDQLDLFVD